MLFRSVGGMSGRRFGRTLGGVCSLGLHLVWCPKYRRGVLGGRGAARCGELVEQIAARPGWQIVAKEVMPDHVHLFVRVGPPTRPRRWYGRSRAAQHASCAQEFPHLRRFAKVLWSPSYFAASVGYVWESTVRRYIEHQWDAVMAS